MSPKAAKAPEPPRRLSLSDRLIQEIDRGFRTVAAANVASRPFPDEGVPETLTDPAVRRHAAALMRVNHAGEIAAQALYHGQALTARNPALREHMLAAAREETDHLAWCERRVRELGSRTSLLAPFWYAGSFAIGAMAGLGGDRTSLGFVDETEKQVCAHLESHLDDLPAEDERSRRIVAQMKADEDRHASDARARGAALLPRAVRELMRRTARVMTGTAYRI
ncbi:MAG TPA: 2-polyprenyl-3-methyl-6-methoxy-1,4-benzoquinone monooxygenase [Steroidobacteraceae bacterium]|jgi:ubiquinone biosynthesis monooxygenase Coq7|nr:2-polyprenyl-3-methyl-6-methoxy-1,4-benzoquinone monooxygenase [Steroidobacteraceae bacterium]